MSYQGETSGAGVASQARQAGARAYEQAHDVVDQAKERATTLAGEAGQELSAAAEAQKDALADRIDQASRAAHRAGEHLEGEEDAVARLIERGAEQLGGLADMLRGNDLQGLMNQVGTMARRQPAVFVGAAMAAGFAVARMGKLAVSGTTGVGNGDIGHSSTGAQSPATAVYGSERPASLVDDDTPAERANAIGEA